MKNRGHLWSTPVDSDSDVAEVAVWGLALASIGAAVAMVVIGELAGTTEGLPWIVLAGAVGVGAAAMLVVRRHRPDLLIVGSAIGIAIVARSSSVDITLGALGGLLLAGVSVAVVMRRARPMLVALVPLVVAAQWWHQGGWLGAFDAVAVLAGFSVAVPLLTRVIRSIRSAEEKYRVLFETASDAIIAVDESSRIILFNEEACRMFGYSADEVLGEPLGFLIPRRFRQSYVDEVERFVSRGGGSRLTVERREDLTAIRSDGVEIPVEVAMSSATVGGKRIMTAFVRDVSERHSQLIEIQEREQRYRELFDRVPTGLYRTTRAGRIIDANRAFVAMLGYSSKDELLALRAMDLFENPSDRDAQLAHVDQEQRLTESEIRLVRADGVAISVWDRTVPVFDESGDVEFYEGDVRDVTEERRVEAELRALVESKSELIAAVSHELRTPLTAVIGFLGLIDEDPGLLSSEGAELVHVALNEATEMSALVEDLLTAARIDIGDLVFAPKEIVLAELLDGVVMAVASEADVEIQVPTDSAVIADPVRVRQILRNLITNALRHGSPPVRVEVGDHEGSARISVIDAGPGVAAADVERIFDAFSRGDEARGLPGSIGIGLTVSRRLARLMGGELSYERREGETWFTVSIPTEGVTRIRAA